MPAAVIPFRSAATARASWSLLEMALPGESPAPLGILLVDQATDSLRLRLRDAEDLPDLEERDADIVACLEQDLIAKARMTGGSRLLDDLEDSLSHFLRVSDRVAMEYTGDLTRTLDRLFSDHVSDAVKPYVTHLPLYAFAAAATKFGEENPGEEFPEKWVRVPGRLSGDMFVARVVGRSMEPMIPDGSLCVFKGNVTGSRNLKRLLIEQFGESSDAHRYTVKQYSSKKSQGDDWEHEEILLTPLNHDFEAFTLSPDQFRVIGEFVRILL